MKKLFAAVLALALALPLFAYEPQTKDVDISVSLTGDGSALITEVWDVVVAKGTEWYLVRANLGDIRISNLSVTDEQGNVFRNEGSWDVDRSREQKARKCGLHSISGGYEICWGVGEYGPHKWTVSYSMSNVVKSLNDYDMLHLQFVSDDIDPAPAHVRLTLSAPDSLSAKNSSIWAFGYNGTVDWQEDGSVTAESSEAFIPESSMILLLRFDKGIFQPSSVQDRSFDDVINKAKEGSIYPDDGESEEDGPLYVIMGFLLSLGMFWLFIVYPIKMFLQALGISKKKDRRRIKDIFGRRRLPANPEWSRDIPFGGNMLETHYIASHLNGVSDDKLSIVPAYILRMIERGVIDMRRDTGGKKEYHFNAGADKSYMSLCERRFYGFMLEAAGNDVVLQEKEFEKWTTANRSTIQTWVKELKEQTVSAFRRSGYLEDGNYYESLKLDAKGRDQAMKALGFRQFLKDFTIIEERHSPEVALWGRYLVVAAIFGMADKVAKDMKKLVPEFSIGNITLSASDLTDVLYWTDSFRASTFRAFSRSNYSSYSGSSSSSRWGRGSSGGFGGHSSFGGGGGFSGGGHGGGSR